MASAKEEMQPLHIFMVCFIFKSKFLCILNVLFKILFSIHKIYLFTWRTIIGITVKIFVK